MSNADANSIPAIRTFPRRIATAALIVFAGTMLPGCSDADELDNVQEGRDALVRLTSSGPQDTRQRAYSQANAAVAGADAEGAVGAAGSIVKGLSGAGLAQLAMDELAINARELGNRIRLLRDVSMGFSRADVTLDELSRYDVDRGIRELGARVVEHRDERRQAAAVLSRLDGELSALRDKVSELEEQATERRARESALRDEALRLDVVARADVIRQANVVRREADAFEKQIDTLSFELEALERRRASAEAAVASSDRLISINERSEQRMRSRADELAREAARVRSERDAQRAELSALAQDVSAFLEGPFTVSLEATSSAFENAAREAGRGRDAGSTPASGATAVVQRGLAKAHLFAMTANESASEVAARLAELGVQSPLDASAFAARANEHRVAAGEAYEAYVSAVQAATRGAGDIDSSIETIEAIARELRGEEPIEEAPADPESNDDAEEADDDWDADADEFSSNETDSEG